MKKLGRPGIPYHKFVPVWEQLMNEGRASLNEAQRLLGGNKGTLSAFKEQYEREKASKELSLIKNIELPDAVLQAIASIKVKEIEALEEMNKQQAARIEEYLATLKETEEKLASAKVDIEDVKTDFDVKKLTSERKLAAAEARIQDMEQREKKWIDRHEKLNGEYSQAKQEAAVAKKEVEMLREQTSVPIEKKTSNVKNNKRDSMQKAEKIDPS